MVTIVTIALLAALAWGISRARAERRRLGGGVGRRGTWSTSNLGLLLVTLTFVVAPLPALTKPGNVEKLRFQRDHGPLSSTGIPNLTNRFDRAALRKFPTLKPGAIVLADLDSAYRLSAVAPVYVVGSVPGHTADTRRNRRAERAVVAASFFDKSLSEKARLQLIDDEHVDYIVASTATEGDVIAFAQRHPDLFTPVSLGRKTDIFAIQRGR
ncbi:MAG: hypothetical protein H7123_02000 [Thermoleophilia bacterium]|nr:hypothetical protein [Thermoleophilia bacterium]